MSPRRAPRPRQSLWIVFAWPIAIAVLSVFGLIVALTGDGWRDTLSWLGLAAAVLPLPWALVARRS
jgi:uncharacterized membrane protein